MKWLQGEFHGWFISNTLMGNETGTLWIFVSIYLRLDGLQ